MRRMPSRSHIPALALITLATTALPAQHKPRTYECLSKAGAGTFWAVVLIFSHSRCK